MPASSSLARLSFTLLLCASWWDSFATSQKRCAVNEMSGFMNCSGRDVSRSIVLLNEKVTEVVMSVDFSGNKLTQIEQLHRYPKATSLNFAFNNISRIRSDTFVNVTKLERLDLSDNKITTLDPFSFSENKHLKELFLRRNPLQLSESVPLLCSASVQVLDLRGCGIASLSRENLMSLPSVVLLDLSANAITVLAPRVFSFTPSLTTLFLGGNDFRCDCDLVALAAWLRSKNTDLSLSDYSECIQGGNNQQLSDCNVTAASSEVRSQGNNDSSSPEGSEYIFITSYEMDIRIPNEEEQEGEEPKSAFRNARIVSGSVYWAQTVAPIVLLVLVVVAWVVARGLFRSARRVNDTASISSDDSIKGLLPIYKEDHTYAQVK